MVTGMTMLTAADRRRVEAAIRAVEAKTVGELVTVIAGRADPYFFVSLLYATGGAFTLPPILWLLGLSHDVAVLYAVQLGGFLGLLAVLRWTPLLVLLVPDSVKQARAARLARDQFMARGLADTPERGGVLLFVAAAERYVEVIADKGIHARVPDDAWITVIARFSEPVRAGRTAEGFLAAIETAGELLMRHMPAPADNPNRLPDVLVEIRG